MKPHTLLFIAFLFFDVVALAWAAVEFWSVRTKGQDDRPTEQAPSGAISPDAPGHPER